MKRGFTLVELAIVLVIVGLLIGGILVGQSMIRTAKDQTIIRTMQQYLIAGRNFKTSYKYWPGDYPGASFGCPGNGDGVVQFSTGGTACTISTYKQMEGPNYFVQLSMAGFIPQNFVYVNTASGGSGIYTYAIAGLNIPIGPDKNSMIDIITTNNQYTPPANGQCVGLNCSTVTSSIYPLNVSFLMYGSSVNSVSPGANAFFANILAPQDAQAIDSKIDDGMPNSGNVIGALSQSPDATIPTNSYGTCAVDATSIYDTAQYLTTAPYNVKSPYATCTLGFILDDNAPL